MTLLISGVGAIVPGGLGLEAVRVAIAGGGAAPVEEEVAPGWIVRVGRVGPVRDGEAARAYKRWGQIDTYSRYGFVAARLALIDAGLVDPAAAAEDLPADRLAPYGVVFGTAYGCVEENQKFDRFTVQDGTVKGASPLVFKGTVDNAPAGWVAVAFRLKGPNQTLVSGDGAGLEAFWAAESMLRGGRAPGLLVGGVERLVDLHAVLSERDERTQGSPSSEGAGIVLVETAEALRARGREPRDARARLIGSARGRELGALCSRLLGHAGRSFTDVGLVSLAAPDEATRARLAATLPPHANVVADKLSLGEPHGAWGGLAVIAAISRLGQVAPGWGGRPLALVHGYGERGEHLAVLLADPRMTEA